MRCKVSWGHILINEAMATYPRLVAIPPAMPKLSTLIFIQNLSAERYY
jgi:deoxyxylulose-5-phosphate synthase